LNRVSDNITKYEATTGYKKSLILYGIGDHGGGPNKEILNRVRDYNQLYIAPDFIHSPSRNFLKQISEDLKEQIPVWNDELYLEYHRGTYTTQAKIKKGNRQSESLISTTEKMASTAHLIGSTYPQEELEQAWKLILTNKFHDILPGSSITPVYRDALETYREAWEIMQKNIDQSMEFIARKIDTQKIKTGTPLIVFNPHSWERTDFVEMEINNTSTSRGFKLLDCQGKEIPLELNTYPNHRSRTIAFIAESVPPMGYKVYSLVTTHTPSDKMDTGTELKVDGTALENKYYKLVVNPVTGNIKSLYSKSLAKEFVQEGKEANVLQIYEDLPERWDAWNIGYTGRMWELNQAESVELVKKSPVRVTLKIKKISWG